jgi:hypothetical protein
VKNPLKAVSYSTKIYGNTRLYSRLSGHRDASRIDVVSV